MVEQYLRHSKEILTSEDTVLKHGSKEMALISLFGYQNKYDLRKGFPLITTKKMPFKTIVHELLWYIKGTSNIKYLADNNVHIWDDNAFDHNLRDIVKHGIFPEILLTTRYSNDWKKARDEYIERIKDDEEFAARWADLGPVYGTQWRHWKYLDEDKKENEIDQFSNLIDGLRKKPTSKRHIVTAWNPGEISRITQPPCHILYQVTAHEGEMDLQLFQRSCDMFLGVPFNIATYSMLTQLIAQQAGLEPRIFVHTFGDSHFYAGDGERAEWYKRNFRELKERIKKYNPDYYGFIFDWVNSSAPPERPETHGMDHVTAILQQLTRTPKPLPKLEIAEKHFEKLTIDDFVLKDYDSYPKIERAMAI